MFYKDLLLVDKFESDFKEKHYVIFTFVDPTNLSIIRGTNLNIDFEKLKNTTVKCLIGLKSSKLVVTEVKV